MQEINIRVAEEEDLWKILEFLSDPIIDNQFVLPLSQREMSIRERVDLKYQKGLWLIALDNEKICGCRGLTYHSSEEVVDFSTFVVHPSYVGRGLGKRIFQKSIDLAIERYNPSKIQLDSWNTNKVAPILARKFGFSKVEEYLDPKKRPPGVKTVVYEKVLR